MKPGGGDGAAAVGAYVAAVDRVWRTGSAREHSYRAALVTLLEALVPGSTVVNDGAQIACGAPDCTVLVGGLPVCYFEAKDVGDPDLDGLRASGNREQFSRYREALGSVAFTDYLDFRFWRNGEPFGKVRVAEVAKGRIRPVDGTAEELAALVSAFAESSPQPITSPSHLARLMAAKARMLQVAMRGFLTSPAAAGSTTAKLMEDFRRVLLPDATADDFADIYAQTLTYGLFAARLHDDTPADFTRFEAASLIPKSNPFLRQLFLHLASDIEGEIAWAVDGVVRLFAAADVASIMAEYGKSAAQSDPMIHFYEDFLSQYDAGLRKDRGVWYTPLPVVQYIVRAVDEILSLRFSLPDGLADSSRISGGLAEPGGRASTRAAAPHRVQILDPALGTGTFAAEVVRRIYSRFARNAGKWQAYVENDLIPRLHGFELLMASYAMAHVKLDLVLAATGYRHVSSGRFNVFLTNSLEEARDSRGQLFSLVIGEEADAANAVKRDCPVMVVIGNPPYSGESQNKGEWITRLLADYKKEPGGKAPLAERNPKWINNDYVKFIRLAQHYVERNAAGGHGIVGFINPNGFADNPTFRGMRWNLLRTFDEIYILDLHGDSKRHDVSPDGSKDENVFDIQPGVSINLFVKTGRKPADALGRVFYAEVWGRRKQKFDFLDSATFSTVPYKEVFPAAPMYLFTPRSTEGEAEYNKGFSIKELMPVNGTGVVTKRDSLCIQNTPDAALEAAQDVLGMEKDALYRKYKLPADVRDWRYEWARKDVAEHGVGEGRVKAIAYRPFDFRYAYYTGRSRGFMGWPVDKLFRHFAAGDNLGLIAVRKFSYDAPPVFVTESISEHRYWSSSGMQDIDYIFPLYLYQDTLGVTERVPNLNPEIVKRIAAAIAPAGSVIGDTIADPSLPTPEAIFDYIYAVLHAPEYRRRYAEFLKVDFPRVPYPASAESFARLAEIGAALRELHLMRFTPTARERDSVANFPCPGTNEVEQVRAVPASPDAPATLRVCINGGQYFDNVPAAAWEMQVGGYQPAQKWLKDRKGRALTNDDCDRYQKAVIALLRTQSLMHRLSAEWRP